MQGQLVRRERLAEDERYREWKGGYRSYDIVKEACIAFGVVPPFNVPAAASPTRDDGARPAAQETAS